MQYEMKRYCLLEMLCMLRIICCTFFYFTTAAVAVDSSRVTESSSVIICCTETQRKNCKNREKKKLELGAGGMLIGVLQKKSVPCQPTSRPPALC